MAPVSSYVTRPLSPETWDDFARLVEANNGVWGGCWCMGFHPEGVGKGHTPLGTVWQSKPTFATERCTRSSFTTAMNASAGASTGRRWSFRTSTTRKPMPRTWARCPTGGSVASSLEAGTDAVGLRGRPSAPRLAAIHDAGGGLIEAYPEQVEERPPQRPKMVLAGERQPGQQVSPIREQNFATGWLNAGYMVTDIPELVTDLVSAWTCS